MPAEDRATAPLSLRYEDVAQDGRVRLEALPPGLGEAIWRAIVEKRFDAKAMLATGTIPILTRFVIEAADDPIAVGELSCDGRLQLAHAVDAAGAVDRLYFNAWVDLHAPRGRTNLPPPDRAGEVVRVGRVFAEHVFTRPFAGPEDRKVRDLHGEVPPARWAPRALAAAADLPPGATPIGEPFTSDPFVFGLAHTDSNQHVNSLVYLSLFEEAVVARLADVGRSPVVLARWIEIGYRKPCFAGDRVSMRFTLAEVDGGVAAFGAFVPSGDPGTDRPHAWVAMGLS
ncbi:MAG: hypothetical protein JSR82_11880 [Verrucomicrobia bacterium]|nr:hypothetical protein [Verrucomicrobiota bacterium]